MPALAYKKSNQNHSYHRHQRKTNFDEDLQSAFFLGKLNKHHNREQVYNQLRRLTEQLDFYIKRFDMPNGANGRGNKGFAFVHCENRVQAQRIISMKFIRLGNQDCEVKPYGGRIPESNCSEGRGTPDSGCIRVAAKFENPLKYQESPENLEMRSRMNSGIQVSESGRSSYKQSSRNVSESDSNEETQKIPLELSQEQQEPKQEDELEINYEQPSLASSHIADSDLHDDWLQEQTKFVLANFGQDGCLLEGFIDQCNYWLGVLMNSNPQTVQEVQNILFGQHTIGCA